MSAFTPSFTLSSFTPSFTLSFTLSFTAPTPLCRHVTPPLQESRLECSYMAKEKCTEKAEQYCYKQEVKTQVEVCDDKFTTHTL